MDGSSLKLLFEILKGARLLIDLFAKIAVSSILIVCKVVTTTGIPNYCHFCLINKKMGLNVIKLSNTYSLLPIKDF